MRADKWLWHARFFKTRGLAATMISAGRLRINGQRARRPSAMVRADDVLTFVQAGHVRIVRVQALSARRGPASEARDLYADLAPADAAAPER